MHDVTAFVPALLKYLKDNKHNSFQLTRHVSKNMLIVVLGHCVLQSLKSSSSFVL